MSFDADELLTIVKSEISTAEGYEDDNISKNRKEALDYFYGRPRGDEVAGNSKIQSLDVADMIEAVMANIMPAFASDTLVEFEPDNDEDIKQSQVESDVINNMIMERNRGYWMLSESIKDALLLRNGICKVVVEEIIETTTRILENTDEVTIALALSQPEANETRDLVSVKESTDEFDREVLTATIKITTTDRTLKVTSVDPTTFLISANTESIFIDDVRFCAERSYPTRSDLIEAGHDKKMVDDLPAMNMDDKPDTVARERGTDQIGETGSNIDPAMATVEQYDCYLRVDADGDGVAELHHLVMAGNKLILDELADFNPYATGTAFVNPHQYVGISLFDKLKNVQDLKTKGIRQWVDNVEANNNPTTVVVEGNANLGDATSARVGKVIRAKTLNAVQEIPMQNLGGSSAGLLEYADKMRSERGGASLDLQGAELQIAGQTAHGVERQMSSKELLAAMMARNLSESLVRSLYLKVHTTMRFLMPGEITTRIGGEFVTVDPGQWNARDRVNVKTGLSTGERAQKQATLEQIIMKQGELLGGGMDGVLVTLPQYHNSLIDWGRATGIDNPGRYWTDPESEAGQAAAEQKQQANDEASQKEEQLNQMIFGMQNQLEQTKIQNAQLAEQMKHQTEQAKIQFDYYKAQLDSETEEAKLIGQATLELEKLQLEGGLRAVDTSNSE